MKVKVMKLLENNTRINHCSVRVGKDFSARAQETQIIEKKVMNWTLSKFTKTFIL